MITKKCEKFHLKNISNSSVKCYTICITFFFRVIHLTSLSRLPAMKTCDVIKPVFAFFSISILFVIIFYVDFNSTTIAIHSSTVATIECAHSDILSSVIALKCVIKIHVNKKMLCIAGKIKRVFK